MNPSIETNTTAPSIESDSPWFVKILLAFSGWLGAFFILGFFGAGFLKIFDSPSATGIVGMLLIASAWLVLNLEKNEFFEHGALAFSIAGQAMVTFSIFKNCNPHEELAFLLFVGFQIALLEIFKHQLHNLISAFLAMLGLYFTFCAFGQNYLFMPVGMAILAASWLFEDRLASKVPHISAVGYGLTLASMWVQGTRLQLDDQLFWRSSQPYPAILSLGQAQLLLAIVFCGSIMMLAHRYHVSQNKKSMLFIGLATVVFAGISIKVTGLQLGLLILILGFATHRNILMALGIVAQLSFISAYYYNLETTLLAKSMSLGIAGIFLLTLRFTLLKIFPLSSELAHE
jgi:uncharacterized membrane protein